MNWNRVGFGAERFVASLLASLTLGHITGAYPLGLRPALRKIASLRSATSDTPQNVMRHCQQSSGGDIV